jgi:hypothetical protein
LPEFDFRPLLIIYSGIVGPFYIIYKVTLLVKSNALEDGYNRLFEDTKEINIPNVFLLLRFNTSQCLLQGVLLISKDSFLVNTKTNRKIILTACADSVLKCFDSIVTK